MVSMFSLLKKGLNIMIRNNVYTEKELQESILDTLNIIKTPLVSTLGPFGTNSIIQDGSMRHIITKDGYTVIKNIFFTDDIPRTIHEFIKRISRNLVMTVGDGSTSSVLVAMKLYESLIGNPNFKKIPPRLFLEYLNTIAKNLEKILLKNAIQVDFNSDDIQRIAAISLNNDYQTAKLIADIFKEVGKHCKVNIEIGRGTEDTYERKTAFESNSLYKLDYLLEKYPNSEVNLEDSFVFMTKDTLTYEDVPLFSEITGTLFSKNQTLVVLAKDFDIDFINFVKTNINLNKSIGFNIHLVTIPLSTKLSKDLFDDMAIYLDATIYDRDNYGQTPKFTSSSKNVPEGEPVFNLLDLGETSKVRLTENKVFVVNDSFNKERIEARLKSLKEEQEKMKALNDNIDRDFDIFRIESRIAQLEKSAIVYYVGGLSQEEKETKKYLLEDAVAAVRSAIEYGYNIGGSIAIPYFIGLTPDKYLLEGITFLDESQEFVACEMINLIKDSFLSVYEHVLSNAGIADVDKENYINDAYKYGKLYNIITGRTEIIGCITNKTVQSVRTDIEILKASISIIGLIGTAKSFISLNTRDKEYMKS